MQRMNACMSMSMSMNVYVKYVCNVCRHVDVCIVSCMYVHNVCNVWIYVCLCRVRIYVTNVDMSMYVLYVCT